MAHVLTFCVLTALNMSFLPPLTSHKLLDFEKKKVYTLKVEA